MHELRVNYRSHSLHVNYVHIRYTYGGRTAEIVYDQDRVMAVSENAGDLILTARFEAYRQYAGD